MASWAATGVKASDCNANSVAMVSGTLAFDMWFSCLMSGRGDNGSGCVRPAIVRTEQHVACPTVVLRFSLLRPECSRRKRVRGLRRGEHLRRAVTDAGQFDQAPVEGPAARLRHFSRGIEHVHAALMTRGALGARLGTIVAVIARISVAEIDGQRQFEV